MIVQNIVTLGRLPDSIFSRCLYAPLRKHRLGRTMFVEPTCPGIIES